MAGQYGITQSDLRFSDERLAQLTDDAGATISTTKVDAAIVAAEEEFHLYAGVFYAVPVRQSDAATVPSGLKQKLIELSRWFLMQNRPEFLRSESDEGGQWAARRKELLAWLMAIADANPRERLPIPDAVERTTLVERGGSAEVVSDVSSFTSTTGYW